MIGETNFGWALFELKQGSKMTRAGWNGKGMWVALQKPDERSKMRKPYLYISCADGELVPWVVSQTDILATDWMIA
jgi:hypothetical protein